MPEVNIIVRAKDEASKVLNNIGDNVGGLNLGMAALGTAGVAAIGATTYAIVDMAWEAAKLEPTRITFENLTESIGATADEMLNVLRPATMGIVADAELMQAANKLMAMGLADSVEQGGKLAEMAVTLGLAMGNEAVPSLENFTLMLANQSIPRLDSFGISSGKVRTRIEELMEATEGMTREEAFMIAVMEQGELAMSKVGNISETSMVKIGQLQATWENLKTEIGKAILEAFVPLIDEYMPDIIAAIEELAPLLAEELPAALGPTIEALKLMGQAIAPIISALKWLMDHKQQITDILNIGRAIMDLWPGMILVRSLMAGELVLPGGMPLSEFMQMPYEWGQQWRQQRQGGGAGGAAPAGVGTAPININTGDIYGLPNLDAAVRDAIETASRTSPVF